MGGLLTACRIAFESRLARVEKILLPASRTAVLVLVAMSFL